MEGSHVLLIPSAVTCSWRMLNCLYLNDTSWGRFTFPTGNTVLFCMSHEDALCSYPFLHYVCSFWTVLCKNTKWKLSTKLHYSLFLNIYHLMVQGCNRYIHLQFMFYAYWYFVLHVSFNSVLLYPDKQLSTWKWIVYRWWPLSFKSQPK